MRSSIPPALPSRRDSSVPPPPSSHALVIQTGHGANAARGEPVTERIIIQREKSATALIVAVIMLAACLVAAMIKIFRH